MLPGLEGKIFLRTFSTNSYGYKTGKKIGLKTYVPSVRGVRMFGPHRFSSSSDIDKIFVFGKHIKETYKRLSKHKKGKIFTNLKEAYDHLGKILHNNDLLMVKGSNATGLNHLSKKIKRGLNSAI